MQHANGAVRLAAVETRAAEADTRSIRTETKVDALEPRVSRLEKVVLYVTLAALGGSTIGSVISGFFGN